MLNTCTNCGKTITYLPKARLWIHENSNGSRWCLTEQGAIQVDNKDNPVAATALEEQDIRA